MKIKTITLTNGELKFTANHYYCDEIDRPIVLCLHGFPDNSNSFRHQVEDIVSAGYKLIAPTMRGYEPSSIPKDNDMSVTAIAGDVIAWIDQLPSKEVHLVGHDWGAAIAYTVAAMAPERIRSITTIAVPHPTRFADEGLKGVPIQTFKSWYMGFNKIPFLSDAVCRTNNWAFLRFLWRRWSPDLKLSSDEWLNLTSTFAKPGVIKAMLSYYRQNISLLEILGLKGSLGNALETIPVPNLAITGENDGCIDTRIFDYTILEKDHPKGVRIERIPNAGHFCHQEKPDYLNPRLIAWFRENEIATVKKNSI